MPLLFFLRFIENTNTGEIFLGVSGGRECPGRGDSRLDVEIEVIRAQASVVFETQPLDALPDVWFENEKSFGINSLGEHLGSIQNQIIELLKTSTSILHRNLGKSTGNLTTSILNH